MNNNKIYLKVLIITLAASGLISIGIVLTGEFNDLNVKLAMVTECLVAGSFTGLCCYSIFHIEKFKMFSIIGMITSLVCTLISLLNIISGARMTLFDSWKLTPALMVLSFTLAHIALLFNVRPVNALVRSVMTATVTCIYIVAFLLLLYIFAWRFEGELIYRVFGAFIILDLLGSVITPMLNIALKESAAAEPKKKDEGEINPEIVKP